MSIRSFNLELDYPKLVRWWEARGAVVLPKHVIPQGWVVLSGDTEVAMSFLLLDVGGKFAVIEFLTTNPAVSYSRSLVDDVRSLIAHIEQEARRGGCTWIMSFVVMGTGEARMLRRLGYETDDGPAHKIFAKPLYQSVHTGEKN